MVLNGDKRALLRRELRQARLASGLRQADVATTLGKPHSHVAKIESGERRIDLIEVLQFCDAVSLDPHALIERIR